MQLLILPIINLFFILVRLQIYCRESTNIRIDLKDKIFQVESENIQAKPF